jgi:hypothetical protein
LGQVVNKFEKYSIVVGIGLSALSAVASAYAAFQTAAQAEVAKQALIASDLSRSFEGFLDSWTELCNTIDVTGGYIGIDVKSAQNHSMIVVEATDLGYDFKPLSDPHQRMKVIKAMDKAVAAQNKLALWLSHDTVETMGFNAVMANLMMLSRVDVSEGEPRHYNAMLKQVGYCKIWKSWYMGWFKEGYPPAPNVIYKDVRLVFNARDGGVLNDNYIRDSRAQPWDEIHKYAPR